jgi:hypothetical protein
MWLKKFIAINKNFQLTIVVLPPNAKWYFYGPFKGLGHWKTDFKLLLKMDESEHK